MHHPHVILIRSLRNTSPSGPLVGTSPSPRSPRFRRHQAKTSLAFVKGCGARVEPTETMLLLPPFGAQIVNFHVFRSNVCNLSNATALFRIKM